MKICYGVLLLLVILNHLIGTVRSNWSIRKIFADNIETDSKRSASELKIKKTTALSVLSTAKIKHSLSREGDTEPIEDEEVDTDDNEYGSNSSHNKKNMKKVKDKLANSVLIKNHHGHLLSEIIPLSNNNESFEILLKPKIMKSTANKKLSKSKGNINNRHNNNKHLKKCNKNENNPTNSDDITDIENDEKSRNDEDYQEEKNDNNLDDDTESGDEDEDDDESSVDENQNGFIRLKCKIKGNEGLNVIIPHPISRKHHDSKKCVAKSKSCSEEQYIATKVHTTKMLHREVMKGIAPEELLSTTSEAVRVNGSVEGIIVMSFNFTDDEKKGLQINTNSLKDAGKYGGVNIDKSKHNINEIETNKDVSDNNEYNDHINNDIDNTQESKQNLRGRESQNNNATFLIISDDDNNVNESRCKVCNSRLKPISKFNKKKNNIYELYEVEEKVVSKPKKFKYLNKHRNYNKKPKRKKLISKDYE